MFERDLWMGWLAGVLQIIGFALLFTPLFFIGVAFILIGGFLFFTSDKVDDASLEKTRRKSDNESKEREASFEKEFSKDPFSTETEEAFNNLSTISKESKNFKNFKLSWEELTKPYKQRLSTAADLFEKAHIEKGEQLFSESITYDEDILGSPEKYESLCNFVGRPKIPELIEDYEYAKSDKKSLDEYLERANKERISFVKKRIKKLEKDGRSRRYIQSKVSEEYNKKYDQELELRRINGKWSVKKLGFGIAAFEI